MVKIMDSSWRVELSPMLGFLKVMYFTGYLPIRWTDQKDGEQECFEISWLKTILLIVFDFLMAMIIPAYVCLWHWLNIAGFEINQLFSVKYYMEFNDGSFTTTICQLVYVTYPFFIFWIYGIIGK